MKSILIASTSTLHKQSYLEYLLPELREHFSHCKTIVFIPYARPSGISHEDYTSIVANTFKKLDIEVRGIHEYSDPKEAIKAAEGLFTGGGNTFLLVSQLYKYDLLLTLTTAINSGTPYLGTSAGSNICGLSMQNTNDMPIIYPQSFKTLGVIPFNINAHYLDPSIDSKHMGETRETRIKEFHTINSIPVLGLREGSWLKVSGTKIYLKGPLHARLFEQGKAPVELAPNTELSFIK